MKTIREWLETLPDGIRERAIKNAEDGKWDALGECADSLSEALGNAFIWEDTDEGYAFWRDVDAKELDLLDDWPPIPEPKPDPVLERLDKIEVELRRLTELLTAEREPEELPESPTPLPRPLPKPWMKPLPEGAALLGKGKTFKVPASGRFDGWMSFVGAPGWKWNPNFLGENENVYYAAPTNSEIAKLNGLEGGEG